MVHRPLILLFVLALVPFARVAAVGDVEVMALFGDQAMVRIDGKQRLLRRGQVSPEGVELISATPHEAVLKIDGRTAPYRLGTRISAAYTAAPAPERLELHPDERGMYSTLGMINDAPVTFLIDTGASHVVMNASEATRLGIDYRAGRPGAATTASGVTRSFGVRLRRVKVGPIELDDVSAVVTDDPSYPTTVLLGMSFLGRLDLRREAEVMALSLKR